MYENNTDETNNQNHELNDAKNPPCIPEEEPVMLTDLISSWGPHIYDMNMLHVIWSTNWGQELVH